jgi:glycosyltransferase involved in cell wall biosynthesis
MVNRVAHRSTNARSVANGRTRLTFVADSAEYGGAEGYVAQLLAHLPDRFEPTLLATEPLPEPLHDAAVAAGCRVVAFDAPRGKFDVGRLLGSARALRATRPDLVHVNLTTAANNRHLIGAAVATRTPSIATLHIVAPILSGLQRALLRRAYGRLRHVVAVSEEVRAQVRDELAVDPQRITVVPNGVERRDPAAPHERTRLRVGALGRLTRQKGFDVLIDAVRMLADEGEDLEVVIGGEGPEREALLKRAADTRVSLVGFVSDVGSFLDGLDVFCLPSRWEGLPFALLEAMMSGLPCIASDVGDVREAVGEAGIVVEPERPDTLAAALRELAASPARRRELGAAAHERALARYTVEAMVEQTVRLYDDALA